MEHFGLLGDHKHIPFLSNPRMRHRFANVGGDNMKILGIFMQQMNIFRKMNKKHSNV